MGAKQDRTFLTFGSYIFDSFKMARLKSAFEFEISNFLGFFVVKVKGEEERFLQKRLQFTVKTIESKGFLKRQQVHSTVYIAWHKSHLPIQQPTSILLNGSTFSFLQHHHGLRFVALFKAKGRLESICHKQIILFMPTIFFWGNFDS